MELFVKRSYDDLQSYMSPKRVTAIYGPRRVGKTTLINHYLDKLAKENKILRCTGDYLSDSELFSSRDPKRLLDWTAGYNTVFIDEAQRIPYIGINLKILIDARPELTIIVTDSSSFDLGGKLGEPLTGRQIPLQLYPFSVGEMRNIYNDYEIRENLEDFLVYGMYPEVRTADSTKQKKTILNELVNAYLLKDILEFERIKKPQLLIQLLALLAMQIGSEVSLNELAGSLKVDVKTISRYLELLEKCFVLYNLRGFSRNLRSEVTRTSKYYFCDNGVRNTVIQNYNPIAIRNDAGALWENFMVTERLKARSYGSLYSRDFFWRTWEKQEIDLLEEYSGCLHAYEFKYSPKKNPRAPKVFMETYPGSEFRVITPENFMEFVII
ncbi:MAG: ATP-binding protein [Treponema sp.]|nr:ATP-binding protein [Treponema sp.]